MRLFLLIVLFLSAGSSMAIGPFGPSRLPFGKGLFYVDFFGGITVPSMAYTDNIFDTSTSDFFTNKIGGVAIRYQFSHDFSLAPQFSYRSLGVSFLSQNNYKLDANYLNVFMPIEFEAAIFGCDKKSCAKAIFFAGPYAGKALNGKMHLDGKMLMLKASDFNTYDYGAEAGIGVRIPTYSANGTSNIMLKVSYYYGLADTYPTEIPNYQLGEKDKLFLSDTGNRMNRGFRATLSLELPLQKKSNSTFVGGGDGKRTYKRFVNIK